MLAGDTIKFNENKRNIDLTIVIGDSNKYKIGQQVFKKKFVSIKRSRKLINIL